MQRLHEQQPPILHNDLKASNVLAYGSASEGPDMTKDGMYNVHVADYECSVGVVGAGFWRAPEILRQLKDRPTVEDIVGKFKKNYDTALLGIKNRHPW
jgi:hypothetical protein